MKKPNVIYKTVVGSRACGTALPTSDIDKDIKNY